MANPAPRPIKKPARDCSSVPLSFREVRFVNAYLEHGKPSQAAREAGYKSISDAGLRKCAESLLHKPPVADYLRECLDQYLDAERVTVPALAQAFRREALADRTQIFTAEGDVINPRDWPTELKALLTGFEATILRDSITGAITGTRYKVKFVNPTEAKRVLAEWRGMIGPKAVVTDSTANGGVTVILEAELPSEGEPESEGES